MKVKMLNTIKHDQDKQPKSNQNSIIDSSNDKVTPPGKYEPRVHSERKKGKSVAQPVDGSYSNNLAIKLHETEANCTFGIINNNSVYNKTSSES